MDYRDFFYSHYVSHKNLSVEEGTVQDSEQVDVSLSTHYSKMLPEDKNVRILDFGCGEGHLLRWLKRRGYANLFGVDLSEDLIAIAKQSGLENVYAKNGFEYLHNEGKESFDVIFAHDLIEHMKREEVIQFLQMVHASLTPNGKFYLRTPNGESPFFGAYQHGDLTHETAYNRHSLRQLSSAVGFSNTECFEAQERFYPTFSIGWYTLRTAARVFMHRMSQKFIRWAVVYDDKMLVTKNMYGVLTK